MPSHPYAKNVGTCLRWLRAAWKCWDVSGIPRLAAKNVGTCLGWDVKCWDVSGISTGGLQNVGTCLGWPGVENQGSKLSVRLWDDSNCRYVSDREKCRYVSGMKQLSPRLWDGAAPEKCRYVSGMDMPSRPRPEARRGAGWELVLHSTGLEITCHPPSKFELTTRGK